MSGWGIRWGFRVKGTGVRGVRVLGKFPRLRIQAPGMLSVPGLNRTWSLHAFHRLPLIHINVTEHGHMWPGMTPESHSCHSVWTYVFFLQAYFVLPFDLAQQRSFMSLFLWFHCGKAVSVLLAPPGGVWWYCHRRKRFMRSFVHKECCGVCLEGRS